MDKNFMTWLLASALGLLTAVGGWIFKQIFGKLKELEDKHNEHKYYVQEQLAKIRSELAINSERDQMNHKVMLEAVNEIKKGQDKIYSKIEEYDKNISLFYQKNPDIKNPEL